MIGDNPGPSPGTIARVREALDDIATKGRDLQTGRIGSGRGGMDIERNAREARRLLDAEPRETAP